MIHYRPAQLLDRLRFDQSLVAARCLLEIFIRTAHIRAANDLARTKKAGISLLFPAIKTKPIVAVIADWIDAKSIPEQKHRAELDGWQAYPSGEGKLGGLVQIINLALEARLIQLLVRIRLSYFVD